MPPPGYLQSWALGMLGLEGKWQEVEARITFNPPRPQGLRNCGVDESGELLGWRQLALPPPPMPSGDTARRLSFQHAAHGDAAALGAERHRLVEAPGDGAERPLPRHLPQRQVRLPVNLAGAWATHCF